MSDTDVIVSRASLRGIRSLAAGVTLGVVGLLAALVVMGIEDQQRCEAGNEFRRDDLPAAFRSFGDFLGGELGADPVQVEDANDRFARQLDEQFPARDCSLFP